MQDSDGKIRNVISQVSGSISPSYYYNNPVDELDNHFCWALFPAGVEMTPALVILTFRWIDLNTTDLVANTYVTVLSPNVNFNTILPTADVRLQKLLSVLKLGNYEKLQP